MSLSSRFPRRRLLLAAASAIAGAASVPLAKALAPRPYVGGLGDLIARELAARDRFLVSIELDPDLYPTAETIARLDPVELFRYPNSRGTSASVLRSSSPQRSQK